MWTGVLASEPVSCRNGAEVTNTLDVTMTFSNVTDGRSVAHGRGSGRRPGRTRPRSYLACGRIEGNGADRSCRALVDQPAVRRRRPWTRTGSRSRAMTMSGRTRDRHTTLRTRVLKGDAGTAELTRSAVNRESSFESSGPRARSRRSRPPSSELVALGTWRARRGCSRGRRRRWAPAGVVGFGIAARIFLIDGSAGAVLRSGSDAAAATAGAMTDGVTTAVGVIVDASAEVTVPAVMRLLHSDDPEAGRRHEQGSRRGHGGDPSGSADRRVRVPGATGGGAVLGHGPTVGIGCLPHTFATLRRGKHRPRLSEASVVELTGALVLTVVGLGPLVLEPGSFGGPSGGQDLLDRREPDRWGSHESSVRRRPGGPRRTPPRPCSSRRARWRSGPTPCCP